MMVCAPPLATNGPTEPVFERYSSLETVPTGSGRAPSDQEWSELNQEITRCVAAQRGLSVSTTTRCGYYPDPARPLIAGDVARDGHNSEYFILKVDVRNAALVLAFVEQIKRKQPAVKRIEVIPIQE